MQKELEEAAKDTRGVSPEKVKDNGGGNAFFSFNLPNKATLKFVSVIINNEFSVYNKYNV